LYRTREEVKEWQAKDPITRFAGRLAQAGWLEDEQKETIRQNAYLTIEEAVAFADASPDPDLSTIMDGVYAD
jgi:pyruvate dehydrogenase E1 component alpha subunit